MFNKSLEKAVTDLIKIAKTEEERTYLKEILRQFEAVWYRVDDNKKNTDRSMNAIEQSQISLLTIQEDYRTFFTGALLKQLKWIVGSVVTIISAFTGILIAILG